MLAFEAPGTTRAAPLVERALAMTRKALRDRARAADLLSAYYTVDSDLPGATFTELLPNDPYSFGVADLLATVVLGSEIPPIAVMRLTEPGPIASALHGLLVDPALAVDLVLERATPETWEVMRGLHQEVSLALAPRSRELGDRSLTASRLCARKRPGLFPVTDPLVSDYLGLGRSGDCTVEWQVYRLFALERGAR